MRSLTDRLCAFNEKFGRLTRARPTASFDRAEVEPLVEKLQEEIAEFTEAMERGDIVGIADGLGDCIYVIAGIALAFGIDIDVILDIVHRSNMTKDATPAGQPIKGDGYRRPPVEAALRTMSIRRTGHPAVPTGM